MSLSFWQLNDLIAFFILKGERYACFTEVTSETVCPHLGIKDSIGNRIFEGDIVEIVDENKIEFLVILVMNDKKFRH